MLKSKMRSMQRGAHKRRANQASQVNVYAKFDPQISEHERLHFGSNYEQAKSFLLKIEKHVQPLLKSGPVTPSYLAKFLNSQGVRTFRNEFWTPRLCWFLTKKLDENNSQNRVKVTGTRQRAPIKPKNVKIASSKTKSKLTPLELEQRAVALRKARDAGFK